MDAYLEKCRFLPRLNNELPDKRNSTYKERFSSLENLVLIMFEHDTVLIPKETSWFGYYPDGSFGSVLPPQQTNLYIEDWIGLKALDDAGRVKYVSVPGNHLGISRSDMKTYIIPYLADQPSKVLTPKRSDARGIRYESPSAHEKSLVHKIFGGCLRSQVKCTQCSYCSNKFDPFLDLSLEIFKADSLHKALNHFTAAEQLDGGERQYMCQQCKQKVRALKQLTIDKAPFVLTIHLKRFGSHISRQKIDKKVQFGPILNLKPYASGSHVCMVCFGQLVCGSGTR